MFKIYQDNDRLDSWSMWFLDTWEDFFAFLFPVMACMTLVSLMILFRALGVEWASENTDWRDY